MPFNVAGYPAISICSGFGEGGLPVAIQLVAKPFQEPTVLRVADAFEKATPFRARRPRAKAPMLSSPPNTGAIKMAQQQSSRHRRTPYTSACWTRRFPPVLTIDSGDTWWCMRFRARLTSCRLPAPACPCPAGTQRDHRCQPGDAPRAYRHGSDRHRRRRARRHAGDPHRDDRAGADWGYNMIRPLAGTLPEDFHETVLSHIPVDRARRVCPLPWGTELPLAPFFGVMGVAPPLASAPSLRRSRVSTAATWITRS